VLAPKKAPQCLTVGLDERVADGTGGRVAAGPMDGVAAGSMDGAVADTDDRLAAGLEGRLAAEAEGVTYWADGCPLDEPPGERTPAKSVATSTAHAPARTSGVLIVTSRDNLFIVLNRQRNSDTEIPGPSQPHDSQSDDGRRVSQLRFTKRLTWVGLFVGPGAGACRAPVPLGRPSGPGPSSAASSMTSPSG
jgi:hypothetical protein